MRAAHASMQHTEASLRRLSQVQYSTFSFGTKLLQLFCGLILIAFGIRGGSAAASVLCLFAGCWVCVSTDIPARVRADKVIAGMHKKYPYTEYAFSADHFTLTAGEAHADIPYQKLIRLVEDADYLYLYISRMSAYMIDKSTASPDIAALRELAAGGSGLRWTRPNSFLRFNLRSLWAKKRR